MGPSLKCTPSPRQACTTTPTQECSKVPVKQCSTVPRQQCSQVPVQTCDSGYSGYSQKQSPLGRHGQGCKNLVSVVSRILDNLLSVRQIKLGRRPSFRNLCLNVDS